MGPYSKTKVLGLALKTLFPEERLSSAKQILRFYILSAGPSLYTHIFIYIYMYIYTYIVCIFKGRFSLIDTDFAKFALI